MRRNKYTEARKSGIKKYARGARFHWDPKNPNHVHIDRNGVILPADYSGSDNAYNFEISVDTQKEVVDAINAHRMAMEDDRYKYISNPEYEKIKPAVEKAKANYEWGKDNWSRYYPAGSKYRMPLSFDERGVGYLNGQTYLPMNVPSEKAVPIPVPSAIGFSQYADYVPVNIPEEKILRTEFPELESITAEVQKDEKDRAIRQYIADNTFTGTVYKRPVEPVLDVDWDSNTAQWTFNPFGVENNDEVYKYGAPFRIPDNFDTVPLKPPYDAMSDYYTNKKGYLNENQFDRLFDNNVVHQFTKKHNLIYDHIKNVHRRNMRIEPTMSEAEKNAKMNLLNLISKGQRGGVINDNMGQWRHPGKVTAISGANGKTPITMRGVSYPVLGVSDKGDVKMMEPDNDYIFKGNKVTEYPVMQTGGNIYNLGEEYDVSLDDYIRLLREGYDIEIL